MSREYPNALEMEKKVLSAMMLKGGKIIPEVAAILKAEDFYREEHKIIFRATVNAYNNNPETPLDILLVEEELERKDELKKVTRLYLFALLEYEFTTARAVTFAQKIKEKAISRQLIESCEKIMYEAYEDKIDVEELLTIADDEIQKISAPEVKRLKDITKLLNEHWERIKLRGEQEFIGLQTGLFSLDKVIQGLRKSNLIILAARPGMGKTALALNIARKASKSVPTLMFSLEMSEEQLMDRLISSESHVVNSRIQSGKLSDGEKIAILDAMGNLSDLQLRIDDTGGLTLSEIRMRAKYFKHKYGLGLIVIDYLQLIQASKEYKGNRVQEVSEISCGLKTLAKELDVPILALSQLSRSVEQRADKRPQLADLRDSGSIEQDADIVMFLYREAYYDRDNTAVDDTAELTIAKNRNGAATTCKLKFEPEYVLFSDLLRTGGQDY